MKLKNILARKGYIAIKLKKTTTNHYEIRAKINSIKGRFILDTGASNSCIGLEYIAFFKLNAEDSSTKAAGAGAIDMLTQQSANNKIVFFNSKKTKSWQFHHLHLVIFDLSHVNTALTQHNANAVHGIIGADILTNGNAIIDYKKNRLFLKRKVFKF